MKKLLPVIFLLFVFANYPSDKTTKVPVLQWPAIIKPEVQISSTFGESRMDHFHAGVDIPGGGLKVKPVAKGRLLWYTNGRYRPNELPFGGGQMVLLDHGSFVSGYMHFRSITPALLVNGTAQNEDIIGVTGDTGHSGGAHLHFFVYSLKENKMYNPLLLLPSGHTQDVTPPVAKEMAIVLPDRLAVVNPKSEFSMKEDYPVGLRINDAGLGRERWGVYTLMVKNNRGEVTHQVKFDFLELRDGKWLTSNELPFEKVFIENYYLLGPGIRQMRDFSLEAKGFSGPAYNEDFQLKILLQ